MVATRADRFTQTQKIPVYYSDFLNSFVINPVTNVLAMVTNERSVSQSIRNLVRTNLGDRPYELDVGTDVLASLFEPNDVILIDTLTKNITYAIKTYEPRANLLDVAVVPSINDDSINIDIVYSMVSNAQPVTLRVVLQRVR